MSDDGFLNPFPGPQPFRAADRDRFFGREDVSRKMVNRILAHPCVTLFGPSGSGKSSLMQASVIPLLMEEHGFRVVRVDGWHADEAPLHRLVQAMFLDLELGAPPDDLDPRELLGEAIRLAERRSDRPILVYLDQLEQPLLPDRRPEALRELLQGLEALAAMPMRGLQLVLALREDYLGRFQDRTRGNRALHDPGFRLGPLTVGEMARVMCKLAGAGSPPQDWSPGEIHTLMLQMRTPGQSATDEAEIQAAFAQIVCRALWMERCAHAGESVEVKAEPILHRYLDATLDALGPWRPAALKLLEEHLVARDGSRTLLTQREAEDALPAGAAVPVLDSLERAAVLHAEQHQGGRYFELGHDWLAKKVLDFKRERLRAEAEARAREEDDRRHERERVARRKLVILTAGVTGVALLLLGLFLWGLWARRQAEGSERRAFNQSLLAGAREQMQAGQPAMAGKLLAEVREPERVEGWDKLAQEALDANRLEVTFRGVTGEAVNAAAFSPDDQRVLTASDEGVARVWWLDRSQGPLTLVGHSGPVVSAAFSQDADGRFIVTASRDGTARVWSARDGQALQVFQHEGPVRSAGFSPDGQRIVTVSQDGIARVWRIEDPSKPVAELPRGPGKRINFAAFSPDPKVSRIVTTSWDETAQVWEEGDSGRFALRQELQGHTGPVTSAAFSPDGQRIVTASQDGTARVWSETAPGAPFALVKKLEKHGGPVHSAAFSADGVLVVTASQDGTARVWRVEGRGPAIMIKALRGHTGPITTAAFDSTRRRVATASADRRVVTASQDGTARVWHADIQRQPVVRMVMDHVEPVATAAPSPDGARIVTASQDGVARIWRADGLEEPVPLEGHTLALTSAAFSPDALHLVTTSWDKTARVWEQRAGKWESRTLDHHAPVLFAAFSPDGQHIATAAQDGIARVWRTDGQGEPVLLKGHEGAVTFVAFSPDGRRVVTASRDKTARVWHADGTGEVLTLGGHLGPVTSATFSPDGRRVVTTSQDGKARVWAPDAGSQEPLHVLPHKGPVQSAAFSPDGRFIVTTSWDATARVWRADGSGLPRVLTGHEGPVRTAVFTPDGQFIVTASWDRTARIWILPKLETPTTQTLLQDLRERNRDCLLPDLRQTYLEENVEESREGYARCEQENRRIPSQAVALQSGVAVPSAIGGM